MRKRALKDEQKLERRQAILDVAWKMFQKTSYAAVTMAAVARRAGLAKGTVFLYFKTKEALFLAVQIQQLEAWFAEVNAALEARPRRVSAADVAALIGRTLQQHAGLTRLLAILSTVLEQNIDLETAVSFKHWLLKHMTATGGRLESRLPFLKPGQGAQLLMQIQALVIGFRHLCDPAPVIRRAMKERGLEVFEINFESSFTSTLHALLGGLENEARRKS